RSMCSCGSCPNPSHKRSLRTDLVQPILLSPPQHHLISSLETLVSSVCGIPRMTRQADPEVRDVLKPSTRRLVPTIAILSHLSNAFIIIRSGENKDATKISNYFPICLTTQLCCSGESNFSTINIYSYVTGSFPFSSLSGKPRKLVVSLCKWATVGVSSSYFGCAWPITIL